MFQCRGATSGGLVSELFQGGENRMNFSYWRARKSLRGLGIEGFANRVKGFTVFRGSVWVFV